MNHNVPKRRVAALKYMFAAKEQRQAIKERERLRAIDRATRKPPPPRRRGWWGDEDHPAEDAAYRLRQRRLHDQHARSKRLIRSHQRLLDAVPVSPPVQDDAKVAAGTVVEVRAADSLVDHEGRLVRAIMGGMGRIVDPRTRSPIAVGDRVQLQALGDGLARIVGVDPRRSALTRDVFDASRRDAPHERQVLAANIDQVVIVCSVAQPPFRPRLIDRYLVSASRDSLLAVICLNKADLGVPEEVEGCLRGYERLGVRCLRTSAATRRGLERLRETLTGRASLLTGHSGVGKSSLLNALEPGLSLRVGAVTRSVAGQGKGRHTTAAARLIPLSLRDTFVVDTPGIRAFGIRGLEPRDLASHFRDLAALAPGCLYRDCLHRGERGCAVAARVRADGFLRDRLDSYRGLLSELR